ncbi:unnamed protein product, partial [Ixodes persulcatus]
FRPHTLCCGEETMDMAEVPDNVDLMTLRLQKQDLEHRASNEIYRTKVARMFRKTNYISKVDFVSGKAKSPSEQRESLAEVVMAVQIYKPIKMPAGPRKVRMGGCLSYKATTYSACCCCQVQAEVAVLGQQTLQSLREKISCVSDVLSPGDFSENPGRPQTLKAMDLYKSGFFFIGNTFYNDMSSPSCKDYSQVIRDWAQNSRREVGPFEARRMEATRFVDLELRLGYPYVYVHQGHCEHLLVFSDLRMLHPDDSQNPHDYPLRLKSFPFGKRVLCMLCHTTIAKWVTYGNERVTDDPFFFCDICFHSYNYTADNKKIGHFRAEPFLDWNAVL